MRFIEKMEQPKKHNGQIVSIRNLIGSSEHIIHAIQNGKLVIDPYIQLVTHSIDEYTGYRDTDIWLSLIHILIGSFRLRNEP